jgi:6-deoxy-6-sulfo-D-fructose transaldolase
MKLFLDSAHINEIKHALEMWRIDGVTTNPKHVQASGQPFLEVIQEIGALMKGTDKTVSVEVNPHLDDHREMVAQAVELAALCPNFVVKLPATEAGFRAIPDLVAKDIRVNLTLVFSATQAMQAMRMGAFYVSPFVGWKEASAEETQGLIEEIVMIRDNYQFSTQVLVAAVRTGRHLADAAVAGADIATAGADVFRAAFDHPFTDRGLKLFQNFWDKTPYR